MYPTVIFRSNRSPVLPSHNQACPSSGNSASFNICLISSSLAPSKTGVAKGTPDLRFVANSIISRSDKEFNSSSFPLTL